MKSTTQKTRTQKTSTQKTPTQTNSKNPVADKAKQEFSDIKDNLTGLDKKVWCYPPQDGCNQEEPIILR